MVYIRSNYDYQLVVFCSLDLLYHFYIRRQITLHHIGSVIPNIQKQCDRVAINKRRYGPIHFFVGCFTNPAILLRQGIKSPISGIITLGSYHQVGPYDMSDFPADGVRTSDMS